MCMCMSGRSCGSFGEDLWRFGEDLVRIWGGFVEVGRVYMRIWAPGSVMGLDDLTIWEAALHKLSDELLTPEEKAQIYSLVFIKRQYMSMDVDIAIRALWRFEPSIYTVDTFSEKDGRALAALFKSLLPGPAPVPALAAPALSERLLLEKVVKELRQIKLTLASAVKEEADNSEVIQ
ncbi:hypothetical protein M758_12G161900 [Ceratodon purpureus]|nr:hypothetical protein M758_12G161900 [Ceratodon purpureus]